ncbi:FAD-dependent oxidoreductase [Devosia rhizoryzae]|uniref:FAD-dependent oxidoreductase n=1 Tax=Devosia rhizoryzae TaxID=2774137 RepID=A0ABX7C128_9HYPH|nr:FAD-dependent oxidoreductase [Devosia rhizoryzae]QQR37935.1 FAD-dependent oxidoreductase [Devosia rhizoryzae]
MRPQHNRLPADTRRGFAGSAIDRSRPLQFHLDGRQVSGFAGDTVLSAAIASGIDTIGTHADQPIGLASRSTPVISPASLANDPQRALPMARTPATNGAEYVTLGGKTISALGRLFQPGRTLGLPLDQPKALARPWRAMPGTVEPAGDLIIIGAGVAGLSAALAAARAGLRVTVVEANPYLGGHSGLFGTQEGEDSPEDSMSRLTGEVAANAAITVLRSTHAFAIRAGSVRVHRVELVNGSPQAKVVDLEAPRIILATGSLERLPIFAGNRLPGVTGTLDAYELAFRFGVWPGHSAVVATTSNPAYRLAMLASDIGVSVSRIADSRPAPASRFIEFSRAYGIVQAPGAVPSIATMTRKGGTLSVELEGSTAHALTTERLLFCGGWQPDLTLWHVAGGGSRWNPLRHRLEAIGMMDDIALAGSAAGFLTRRGCIQSGADAVDALLGRERHPIEDPVIDALYETPDGTCPVGPIRRDPESYLDGGAQLLTRPHPPRRRWPFGKAKDVSGVTALSEAPQPLSIAEVGAGVDLELIPHEAAGVVAQERVALVPLSAPSSEAPVANASPEPDHIPAYLHGRFGPEAQVVRLIPFEQRRFSPGALIYRTADADQPLLAIGVVLRQADTAATALVEAAAARANLPLSVRDHGRAIPVKIVS